MSSAVISAAYTLYYESPPRCWWFTLFNAGLNAAAPILFAMPEPSVYIIIVSLDVPSHIRSCSAFAVSFAAAACIFVGGVHHGG
jgi:hypothetical protein